jgi:hypothetical protein
MDLTAVMSGIQTAKVRSEIDFAVAKKALDTQKQAGAGMLRLLQASMVGPGDEMVAAATGLGGSIDAYG